MTLPLSFIAARIALAAPEHAAGLVAVMRSERRAQDLARLLEAFRTEAEVVLLPPWDCLPFDRSPPSAEAMGGRLAAMRRIREAGGPFVVVTTPDALWQRMPPPETLAAVRRIGVGEPLDPETLAADLQRAGYVEDTRIDEPGEIAVRGQVFEIFAAGTGTPVRLQLADGRVEAIRVFDPASQRTVAEIGTVVVDPASEVVDLPPQERASGIEHWLPAYYHPLVTLGELVPDARLFLDDGADARAEAVAATVAEGYRDRMRWRSGGEGERRPPPDPAHLYITPEEWSALLARTRLDLGESGVATGFDFAAGGRPWRALAAHLEAERKAGRRILICAASTADLARLASAVRRDLDADPAEAAGLAAAAAGDAGSVATLLAPADAGFSDPATGISLVAAADVLGSRARSGDDGAPAAGVAAFLAEDAFALGDVVIHVDNGVGVLEGLETVESAELGPRETLRIGYAGGGVLLAPVEEIDKVWRYGSDPDAVTLDRLGSDAWPKRRARVEAEIEETARAMVALAAARAEASAPRLTPPRGPYEAFVRRFPYPPTADQARAIDDVLADLAAGRPMDRLVVGDVGYGKTEVALRAAAVAALSGHQVAIAAPTTVLVRQHLATFTRRFADLGVTVGHLSRLVSPAEAKRVKAGLASGEVRVVVGTHALAGKGVDFADLALVVIDEEQRFGTAHKRRLRELAGAGHVLTLTATPIPRTLQSALVGLQDLSVILTPPARRRPIRTFTIRPDVTTVRQALLRERRRGGQSFVVVPRIEEIDRVVSALREALPGFDLVVAHGRMKPAEVDAAMVRFADGEGDVLVSTSIIETGLDVPRANTMVVWNAELFGLAQLHQLRGRVGRGRVQGVCYLLSEAEDAGNDAAARRLGTLATLDRLGAGMEISARDLDARGAGDLVGDEQAGHLKLIGPGLYQRLLERALDAVRGRPDDDWTPELNLDLPRVLPAAYVPEAELRITLYSRFARSRDTRELDQLADELEDRFGPPPPEVDLLFSSARLRVACRRTGVARIDAGPQAVALTLRPGSAAEKAAVRLAADDPGAEIKGERLVVRQPTETPAARLELAETVVARLGSAGEREQA